MLPDKTLIDMTVDSKARSWRHALERPDVVGAVLVAELPEDGVVGFASAGHNRHANLPFAGEVQTLYVIARLAEPGHRPPASCRLLRSVARPWLCLGGGLGAGGQSGAFFLRTHGAGVAPASAMKPYGAPCCIRSPMAGVPFDRRAGSRACRCRGHGTYSGGGMDQVPTQASFRTGSPPPTASMSAGPSGRSALPSRRMRPSTWSRSREHRSSASAAAVRRCGTRRSPKATPTPIPHRSMASISRPTTYGRGIGRLLLGRLAARLAASGHRNLCLWAFELNAYRGFYDRLGGKAEARAVWHVGDTVIREMAYGWADTAG